MSESTAPAPKLGRLSRITCARLVNLGDYEHERWEFSVDIRDGDSAAETFAHCKEILARIGEKPPHDKWQVESARRELEPRVGAPDPADDHARIYHEKIIAETAAYEERRASLRDMVAQLS